MGIETEKQVYVECDNCGSYYSTTHSQQYVKKKLRREGWTFGKRVFCADCARKHKTAGRSKPNE